MHYLPKFPLYLSSITLLGITLLLGLFGGELARRIRYLPQVSGYILIGFLIGPGGFNIVNSAVLQSANIFIDITLCLILFELGRYLDFKWLKHDYGIIYSSIAESLLTFMFVFSVLFFMAGMKWLPSLLVSTIAIATSPAVVMMVAHDLSAEGPVTRRALILTSLNNLYALIIFVILAPMTKFENLSELKFLPVVGYQLFGAFTLSMVIFGVVIIAARIIGKNKENQFILYVGAVLLSVGLAHALRLPSMLTLFILGVAARNLDYTHDLLEIKFGWLTRLFLVILFVVTGVHLKLQGLLEATGIVFGFIVVRILAKIIGIWLFARRSQLTPRQSVFLSFALIPMAGVAIGMSNKLVYFNPDLGNKLLIIIAAAVTIFNIIGPITTQLAFILAGESLADKKQ